jgi:TM2 domain-containing membrane protein YozV
MRADNKMYFKGLIALLFGGAGMAEHITSGQGSFLLSTIVFAIGFGLICWSYKR